MFMPVPGSWCFIPEFGKITQTIETIVEGGGIATLQNMDNFAVT